MENVQNNNSANNSTGNKRGRKSGKSTPELTPEVNKPAKLDNRALMFVYFEGKEIKNTTFGTAKKNNVSVKFAEKFVETLANDTAKLTGKNTGIYYLNEFRMGRVGKHVTEKRLVFKQRFLQKQYSCTLDIADVERAIMLGAIKLWGVGTKLDPKFKPTTSAVTASGENKSAPESTPKQNKGEINPGDAAVKAEGFQLPSFQDFVVNKGIDFDGMTTKSAEYKELHAEYTALVAESQK